MKQPIRHLLLASLLASTFSAHALADDASCRKVRFAEIGWADITATTGVAMSLSRALGYEPSKTLASVPIAFTGVKNGQVDAFLGYWSPSMDPVIEPFLKDNGLKVIEPANLEGAKYTLAVPRYAAEAGLKSFQDLARFKDELGGRIYAIEPGNDGNLLIENMIKENLYGLGEFKMIESSEAGMLVQVQRAIRQNKWVAFLGWAPHPMNSQYEITYLSGGDDVFGPDYGAAKVFSVVKPDYQQRCPNIGKLISQLRFTVEGESQLMEDILDKKDPETVANTWMKNNPEVLERWLDGITTFDGQDGLAAARRHVGL